MDLINFITEHWAVISAIGLLLYTLGKMMQKMKGYLIKEQVEMIVENKFTNHCPYSEKIIQLENSKVEMMTYREKISTELKTETKTIHDTLSEIQVNQQEIKFNLIALCKMQGVDYIDANGKK